MEGYKLKLAEILKALLPQPVYERLLRARMRRTADRMFPQISTRLDRVGYIAYKYGLEQASYYAKQGEWDNQMLLEGRSLSIPTPESLFPWHGPALAEMELLPKGKSARVLDICCGIPTFLEALNLSGFTELFGTEDNSFMPNVVEAAREYVSISNINAKIYDVRTGYAGDYRNILKTEKPFDVITNFGVATYIYFPLIYDLLAERGLFIAETYFENVPAEFSSKFELVRSYPEYGFRLRKFAGSGAVSVFRKK